MIAKTHYNMNSKAQVRLTEEGHRYMEQRDRLESIKLGVEMDYRDNMKDGLFEVPLWEMFSIFGSQMEIGINPLFEKNEIIIETRI